MILTKDGIIELKSTNTEDFIQKILELTEQGHTYIPNTGFMMMGSIGKVAKFKQFKEEAPEVVTEDTVQAPVKPVEDVLAPKVSDSTSTEEKPLEELTGTPVASLPDWDLVKSFKDANNQKGSKDKLAEYAMKEFNLKLKKNVSFEKMVKIFEETL